MSSLRKKFLVRRFCHRHLRALGVLSAIALSCWYYYSRRHTDTPPSQRNAMIEQCPADEDAAIGNVSLYAAPLDHRKPQNRRSRLIAYNDKMPLLSYHSERSLSIILPVLPDSMPEMTSTLLQLLRDPSWISEVILVASTPLHTSIRDILRSLLTTTDSYVDFEISIYSWLSTTQDQASSILQAMAQVTSARVLILEPSGFVNLRRETVRSLLNSPSLELPSGPRVYDFEGNDFICFSPLLNQTFGFLTPPFIIPTSLLSKSGVLFLEDEYGPWASLADHISLSSPDGVAGVVTGLVPAGSSSCSSEHSHYDAAPLLGVGSMTRTQKLSENSVDRTTSPSGTFAFVFPSHEDLEQLSTVICRIQKRGHNTHALLFSTDTHDRTGISGCRVKIVRISEPSSLDNLGTTLSEWILALPSLPDVILTPAEDHGILAALDFVMTRYSSLSITRIRIPVMDLPFCDWMGALSLDEWRNWHQPKVDIAIITNDRPDSLKRLLKSLSDARFFGDRVDLRINLEQTADKQTSSVASDFQWNRGAVSINRRIIHGGLLPAVVESWYPQSGHSYGLLLEDDVELSPLFYAWVKMTILHYRYGDMKDRSHQLFGISLYQQKNLELRPEGRHRFSPRLTFSASSITNVNTPYLSQIPCSWGAVYFPEHWQQFHEYLSLRLSDSHPSFPISSLVTPGVRSNKWTRSWKKYFIEMAYLQGYVMLYPNYQDYLSLSTNHLEVGSHVKDMPQDAYVQKQKLFLLPLLQLPPVVHTNLATGLLDLPKEKLPPWNELPTLDLLGILTDRETLQNRGILRANDMFGCGSKGLTEVEDPYLPSWLCA